MREGKWEREIQVGSHLEMDQSIRFARFVFGLGQVMVNLDRDGDGEVSKAEFRVAFKTLFPNAKFEPVWKRIDQVRGVGCACARVLFGGGGGWLSCCGGFV